jgi:SAM-dependent methyltransferase
MTDDFKYWDSIYETFKKDSAHSLWRSHSDAVNIALLGRWLPKGKTGLMLKTDLFDEAISNGMYPFLTTTTEDIIGIDISSLIVKEAKNSHNGLKGSVADVRSLPFHENAFDIIVSISTLDHFASRKEIINSLREFHRVLRKGGRLILTLDNLINPVISLRAVLPFSLLKRTGIVSYYFGVTAGPRYLRRVLGLTGFEIINTDAVMHCPRALAVALAHSLERKAGPNVQRFFLRALMGFEHLSILPTRFLTGYFVAVNAVKP